MRNGDAGASGCGSGGCGCNEARRLPTLSALDSTGQPEPSTADGTTRRDFLKVMGVAGAGAATFGCGSPDIGGELLPYLIQHEEIVPGVSRVYATALPAEGPEPFAVHAVTRDGRVIKLEGNPDFPTNRGRLSALGQSAIQDLYDPDRIPTPLRAAEPPPENDAEDGDDPRERFEEVSWEEAVQTAATAVAAGPTVLLTGPSTGTTARFYEEWAQEVGAEHVPFDAFDHLALRAAHEIAFGTDALPSYALDQADYVVSFGADFLGTWLAPVELSRRFARARAVDAGRYASLAFVGPRRSLTGANADRWIQARAGTEGAVALAVGHVVARARGAPLGPFQAYSPDVVAEAAGVDAAEIQRLGEELAAAESAVALPPGHESQGTDAVEMHLAVALLNDALGAYGRTVRLEDGPMRGRSVGLPEIAELLDRMRAGQVRTLLIAGTDPAYTLPAAAGFREAVGAVETVIAVGPHLDDTAALAHLILPAHHALESWGDVEARDGLRALAQPVMQPVFDTRQREDILLEVARAAGRNVAPEAETFADYLRESWRELHAGVGAGEPFDDWWRERLRRGGLYPEREGETPANGQAAAAEAAPVQAPALTQEARTFRFGPAAVPEGTALVVYPTVQFYDGRGANRRWQQELPDPVTRNAWNSWVELHPETAATLEVTHGDVVEVRSEVGAIEAPVYVYPGIRPDTVAIPMGQGHVAFGRYARGRGVNPLALLPARAEERSGALAYAGVSVELEPTGRRTRLVNAQGHDSDIGREIAVIQGLTETRERLEAHETDPEALHPAAWDSDPVSPYRWGMSIDMNGCTGCGACVVACYAENNVPVVGEEGFARGREMSWLRISRYWKETEEGDFVTAHQPTLCQHCGDAPCEPVCPVYAAYHTSEGLNAQVYNRCVGTRYCSNNCPYKVRRFNWFTYDFPYPLNLQLNPDVTVREKGVMEKCTFCIQRINRAKLDAKEEGRLVRDGEVLTACQQTCPADAIVFGNLKDPGSRVSELSKSARGYGMLGELGTRPAIAYLHDVTTAELAPEPYPVAGVRTYREVRPGEHEHNVAPSPDAYGRPPRDRERERPPEDHH